MARLRNLLLEPPRTGFHVVAGLLALLMLWAGTLPGVPILPIVWLTWLLTLSAVMWGIKLTVHLVRRQRGTATPAAHGFALAPIGGVVVLLLLASGAAFHVRWDLSRPSLERAVMAAQADPGFASKPTSPRIGLYRFLGAPQVVGDAVLFHHPLGGGLFDDAGFAYLPDGLTPVVDEHFESLRIERIEGPWYRWWSSW